MTFARKRGKHMTLKELRAKNRRLKTQVKRTQRELQRLYPMLEGLYNILRWKDTGLNRFDYEDIYDESNLYQIERTELQYKLQTAIEALEAVYGPLHEAAKEENNEQDNQ